MMHFTVIATGSRGDVQPLMALAKAIKARGHVVRFATHVDFEPLVHKYGMEYFRMTGNATRFFAGRAAAAMRDRMRKPREFLRFSDDYLSPYIEAHLSDCWRAAQGTEALLCWSWMPVGHSISEKLHIPYVVVSPNPLPLIPTWAFPNPFNAPVWRLGAIYNRLTWLMAEPLAKVGDQQVNRWRRETLDLPERDWRAELKVLRRTPHLFGYSPTVLPKPWDWGDWLHVTGYWFMDEAEEYQPPKDLVDFLAAGPPPVAVGFSSLVGRDPKQTTRTVVEALGQAGQRGILISGAGGLKNLEIPKDIFTVKSVPYDWLLPQVSAMVHHGGSGSTAAALRAGIPNLAVPFGYEQMLWGQCVAKLGAGVSPLPIEKLTAEKLAKAVSRITRDGAMRERAQRLAETIRAEDGIARAAVVAERIVTDERYRKAAVA